MKLSQIAKQSRNRSNAVKTNKGRVTAKKSTKKRATPKGSTLLSSMKAQANLTTTENGAKTFKSTESKVLDLFSRAGAMRTADQKTIETMISQAWAEDSLLTLKCLFYLRNIRGVGQGERRLFRIAINWLARNERVILTKNLEHISKFGRWDDLVSLIGSPAEKAALEVIKTQFFKDIENYDKKEFGKLSLLAKWLPSINTSSKATVANGHIVKNFLGLNDTSYRKILSALRGKLNVVERDMVSDNWKNINYSSVPSRASSIYSKAFRRHDESGYQQFLDDVKSGKKTINAGTLYPYDLVHKVRRCEDSTVDAQWNALPDYCEGSDKQALVVVDVSGSMTFGVSEKSSVTAMDVAISMGLYFGERIEGPFKNHFITFSESPQLQLISGSTLHAKVSGLARSRWGMSTNLQSVFNMVLAHATRQKVSQEQMPDTIVIVSDMQFNVACKSNTKSNFEAIQAKYEKAGYKMPTVVFWNVNARVAESPVTQDERGVSLVSGFSPSAFKYVTSGVFKTPYEVMVGTLNDPIFDCLSL